MARFIRSFSKKLQLPDRVLQISERVYVFDSCVSTTTLSERDYQPYLSTIVSNLQIHHQGASFMVFNFGEEGSQISTLLSDTLTQFDTTVVDYPLHYQGTPLLPLEMIHYFLRSSYGWLSLEGQKNVILLHCERGGWPVLAFMLAGLLLYSNRGINGDDQKTLEMVHKHAPKDLMLQLTPMDPRPSQLRYLHYVSIRNNPGSQWPPTETPKVIDCILVMNVPLFDQGRGCRPVVRIYGQHPLRKDGGRNNPQTLFSSFAGQGPVRYFAKDDCALVKLDIRRHVQGDVLLEFVHLCDDLLTEAMVFKIMFHTAFVQTNVLHLTSNEVDVPWSAKGKFPKDFTAEVLFSDIDDEEEQQTKAQSEVVSDEEQQTEAPSEVASDDEEGGHESESEFFEAEEFDTFVPHESATYNYNDSFSTSQGHLHNGNYQTGPVIMELHDYDDDGSIPPQNPEVIVTVESIKDMQLDDDELERTSEADSDSNSAENVVVTSDTQKLESSARPLQVDHEHSGSGRHVLVVSVSEEEADLEQELELASYWDTNNHISLNEGNSSAKVFIIEPTIENLGHEIGGASENVLEADSKAKSNASDLICGGSSSQDSQRRLEGNSNPSSSRTILMGNERRAEDSKEDLEVQFEANTDKQSMLVVEASKVEDPSNCIDHESYLEVKQVSHRDIDLSFASVGEGSTLVVEGESQQSLKASSENKRNTLVVEKESPQDLRVSTDDSNGSIIVVEEESPKDFKLNSAFNGKGSTFSVEEIFGKDFRVDIDYNVTGSTAIVEKESQQEYKVNSEYDGEGSTLVVERGFQQTFEVSSEYTANTVVEKESPQDLRVSSEYDCRGNILAVEEESPKDFKLNSKLDGKGSNFSVEEIFGKDFRVDIDYDVTGSTPVVEQESQQDFKVNSEYDGEGRKVVVKQESQKDFEVYFAYDGKGSSLQAEQEPRQDTECNSESRASADNTISLQANQKVDDNENNLILDLKIQDVQQSTSISAETVVDKSLVLLHENMEQGQKYSKWDSDSTIDETLLVDEESQEPTVETDSNPELESIARTDCIVVDGSKKSEAGEENEPKPSRRSRSSRKKSKKPKLADAIAKVTMQKRVVSMWVPRTKEPAEETTKQKAPVYRWVPKESTSGEP